MELHLRCISFRKVRFDTQVGISPVREFLSMYRYIKCVIEHMHVGMVPVKPAWSICKYYKLLKSQIASGIVDVSLFSFRYNDFKNGKHPIESDSWPVKPNVLRFSSTT